MFVHLRITAPASYTEGILSALDDPRVFATTLVRGAAINPPGDLIECQVAREAADEVLTLVDEVDAQAPVGTSRHICVTIDEVPLAHSHAAAAAERAAFGSADDSVIWSQVINRARTVTRPTFSFYAFLILATLLAAIAVITDSPVLVVGAMVVGPEFGLVAAVCVLLAFRRWSQAGRAALALVTSFLVVIAVVAVVALLGVWAGWFDASTLARPRPMTGFIWHPDRWSVLVALLAGAAGALAVTTGKSDAMVGVFISVTTVPAAGNLALALATWSVSEMRGSALQLLVNLTGMVTAGTLVVLAQRVVWRRVGQLPIHAERRARKGL